MDVQHPQHPHGQPVKPALKHRSSGTGAGPSGTAPTGASSDPAPMHPGIVWNEENLAENERIKASLPRVKISEPKTPFHELLPDDDIDLQPLHLDGDPAANGTANGHHHEDEAHANGNGAGPHHTEEEKKRFAEARKAHYNMRAALQHKHCDEDEDEETTEAAGNGK